LAATLAPFLTAISRIEEQLKTQATNFGIALLSMAILSNISI